MKKDFRFQSKSYVLEIKDSVEAEGDFKKCPVWVTCDGKRVQGVFKLTSHAWDAALKKAQGKGQSLEGVLAEAAVGVLKAELYIRQIPEGFSYVVDHRFLEGE
jgi:hypothetical protein